MVLESTMICVDNSDYMRNGDFLPNRLQAQQDAVNLICHSKTRSNPENNVGLLTLASNIEVLATLTSDSGRILSKLHQVQPKGYISLHVGIRIAHLALKHRQGKNHKMRIVVFVGSPVTTDEKELIKLAKKLKKEKVNVDIISFGEDEANSSTLLTNFINTLNGKEGSSSSHLVTVPPGPHSLSEALISSPIIQGEDGSGGAGLGPSSFEFGVDPNEDPELALALRVSMEEQRQRQEEEAKKARDGTATDATSASGNLAENPIKEEPTEEALLERALAMSMETGDSPITSTTSTNVTAAPAASVKPEPIAVDFDFANMTEDEQIAFAMQMSMQESQDVAPSSASATSSNKAEAMEVDADDDYSEVMNDPEFLQSVLENLPGVDPQSEAIRQAVGTFKDKKKDEKPGDKQKK